MSKPAICGVYRITSPSGSCYIGSSLNVKSRWYGHRSDLRRGHHHCEPLQRAAVKYGVAALRFELVAECDPSHLRELEQLVIDLTQPQYNASASTFEALSGLWRDPEFRARNTKRAAEQLAKAWRQPDFRIRQAAGASRALRQLHKDPEFAERHRQRAVQRLTSVVNTPEVKERAAAARRRLYETDPAAAQRRSQLGRESLAALRADPARMSAMRETAKSTMKAMRSDPAARERNRASVVAAHSKPVQCVDTGIVYPSAEAAAKACGLASASGITSVLNGRRKTAGGRVWVRGVAAE